MRTASVWKPRRFKSHESELTQSSHRFQTEFEHDSHRVQTEFIQSFGVGYDPATRTRRVHTHIPLIEGLHPFGNGGLHIPVAGTNMQHHQRDRRPVKAVAVVCVCVCVVGVVCVCVCTCTRRARPSRPTFPCHKHSSGNPDPKDRSADCIFEFGGL
jgi:hypothetical protein